MCEVPVSHYPRTHGRSSGANPRVIARAFRELATLYRELKLLDDRQTRPVVLPRDR